MPRKNVNIGTNPNDSTGDTLRTAFSKINDNFTELYGETAADSQISFSGNEISANQSNADLVLRGSGTGGVQLGALRVDGTSISSDDSTVVNINENVIVEGTITSNGVIIADSFNGDGSNLSGITADQIGDLTTIGSTITAPSNADLTLATAGTGSISLDGIQIKGTSISSTDSTQININENMNVDGNVVFTGTLTGDGSGLTGITATTVSTPFSVDNLNFDDNIISSDSNADIIVNPGGTGAIELQANTNIDGDATATTFIGAMRGATVFQAKATEDISKGEAVYISGLSGNTPEVALARANSASTMPAFGIAESDIANTATGNIVTFGSSTGHDVADFGETSITFALGDTVFISSAEAGKLTNVAPTGESNLIQNIGKIERVTPTTNMTIKVGGAGRTNATPALNDGNIFIGNGSNQSSTVSLATQIKSYTGLTVVGDDSSGTGFNIGETIKVAGATGITTAVSGDTLTITGPDLSSYITASSSDTLTNKTIDANGTGNSITNLEVADFAAASIVTAAEGIGSNNNDTTIPTSAAVKAYADSVGGDTTGDLAISGSTITAPSNADLTLTTSGSGTVTASGGFTVTGGDTNTADLVVGGNLSVNFISSDDSTAVTVGDSLNVSGTFSANTIDTNVISSNDSSAIQINDSVNVSGGMTVAGGDLVTADISSSGNIDAVGFTSTGNSTFDGVQISDNTITSASSNADLQINASGTGTVVLENLKVGTGATVTTILDEDNMSSNSATALATQQSIKAYVDAQNTAQALTFVGDDSSGTAVNTGETFKFAGATGVTTAVSGDTLTITGPDLSSYITASSSDTLTNKTFDVEGTGNSISNIDVADFKAAAIVTEAEGIGSNDNDTTIPTSAAVKDYVDNNAGGTTGDLTITGSTISAPSNADLTLNAGGTGSVDIDGIQIKGTEISSTDSTQVTIKENLHVTGTISGTVDASGLTGALPAISGANLTGVAKFAFRTVQIGGGNSLVADDAVDTLTIHPGNNVTITDDDSLDSFTINVNGMGDLTFVGSTIISPSNADITLSPGGTGSVAMPGVTITDNTITSNRSNDNLELDASGTGEVVSNSPFKFNAGYIEKINALTSSSTITVNCATASIHTVTLGTSTEFNITNLPTGGSVTLIITQDGTGNRTATFGTDGSSAVKFPSNSSTLSTGGGDIDVVTIINDGTNFLGNIAKDYRSS
jgi:hypothetical protein